MNNEPYDYEAHVQPFIHYETSGILPGQTIHHFDTSGIPDLGRTVDLDITSYSHFVSIFVDIQKKGGGRFGRDSRLSHTFDFDLDDNLTIPLFDDVCLCVTAPAHLVDGEIFWIRLQRYDQLPNVNKKYLRDSILK